MKNMNNERAKFAYDELKNITSEKSDFRSLARSFPTIVQANGLTVAVALLYSKKDKNAHGKMYGMISKWLHKKEHISEGEKNDLMNAIANIESDKLRLATAEVMALLVWIKRFAEGMFKADE